MPMSMCERVCCKRANRFRHRFAPKIEVECEFMAGFIECFEFVNFILFYYCCEKINVDAGRVAIKTKGKNAHKTR